MPRANLFIADDVGLGKTIEAGLVLQELLLRQRVEQALIVCPASVTLQWRDEMQKKFGLQFEIYDRKFVSRRRQERGFGVNPWTTHTRFIISYQTLRRPEYRDPLLAHLGERAQVAAHPRRGAGFSKWAEALAEPPAFPGARFYLLHSLSHLVLTALSLECGYSASAIRERIYCSLPNDLVAMGAILLATGSSGTERTLGGLVDQGRHLHQHLRAAWDLGVLCSNDPVCGHHTPRGEQTGRLLEGAACHGCLFVAECSCERFNQYLDRALVVPTLGSDPDVAFFRERP